MEEGNKREVAEYKKVRELREREDYSLPAEFQREYDTYVDDEINLRDYIDVLIRRKWVVVICLVIAIVTAAVASMLMDRIYKAAARIEISPENPKITSFEEVVEVEARARDFYETQYQLIQSKTLAKEVIDRLGLDSHPEFGAFVAANGNADSLREKAAKIVSNGEVSDERKLQEVREQALINAFLVRLAVEPDPTSRLATVTFDSKYPELSAKVVNTLVDEYIQWVVERKVGTTKAAREFLDKQLQQVKASLERAEEELSRFAKGIDIFALEGEEKISPTYQQLIDLNKALSTAEAERFAKEALFKEVQSGNYQYLPQIINDSALQTLNGQYTDLKAQYDNLAVIYGANYPDMKQLDAQVARIKSDIDKRIEGIAEGIKKDYQAALTQEDILRERIERQKGLVTNLNEKAIQYRILEREVDTNKSIYENLLQRLKETEVTSGIKATNIQVVDYASVPLVPYKPDIMFNMFVATLIGIMGGVLLAFVFEHFDNTIKDEEELKRRFSLVFLGAVPMVAEGEMESIEKAAYSSPKSLVAEAYRVVRTSILYSSADHSPRSLLVTSSQPLEGKTTSSSNIAISMIQSGLRVILVDADLRKPRLHKVFLNGVNAFGLSSYLVGKMDVSGLIKQTEIEGLDMISSGPIPPNPAELLGSKRMKELVGRLLEDYDHVILDGPPVMGFADSRLLSRSVDGVLLVTSLGITQRQPLKATIEDIVKVGGKIVGAIVNRFESGRGRYGYGYRYNSYYYYYGHDADGKSLEETTYRKKKNRFFLRKGVEKRKGNSSF